MPSQVHARASTTTSSLQLLVGSAQPGGPLLKAPSSIDSLHAERETRHYQDEVVADIRRVSVALKITLVRLYGPGCLPSFDPHATETHPRPASIPLSPPETGSPNVCTHPHCQGRGRYCIRGHPSSPEFLYATQRTSRFRPHLLAAVLPGACCTLVPGTPATLERTYKRVRTDSPSTPEPRHTARDSSWWPLARPHALVPSCTGEAVDTPTTPHQEMELMELVDVEPAARPFQCDWQECTKVCPSSSPFLIIFVARPSRDPRPSTAVHGRAHGVP